jgi:hypothetical protein
MESPAAVLRTNKAIACWRKRPTITVGLNLNQGLYYKRRYFNSPRYFSPILGGNIESDLENEKTENIDSAVSKCSTLRKGFEWLIKKQGRYQLVATENRTQSRTQCPKEIANQWQAWSCKVICTMDVVQQSSRPPRRVLLLLNLEYI